MSLNVSVNSSVIVSVKLLVLLNWKYYELVHHSMPNDIRFGVGQ